MATFQAGKTYFTRSVCDHNCIFSVTIASRTSKTVTTDKAKTFRVTTYEGVEQIKPCGSYSMAPIIAANKEKCY